MSLHERVSHGRFVAVAVVAVFWDTPADNVMVWLRKVGHSPYGIGLDAFVLLVGGCLRDMEEIADETEKECFESETRTED